MIVEWIGVKKKLALTEKEEEDKRVWFKKHANICADPLFYIHQDYTGGIGVGTDIGCLTCGIEADITDVSVW